MCQKTNATKHIIPTNEQVSSNGSNSIGKKKGKKERKSQGFTIKTYEMNFTTKGGKNINIAISTNLARYGFEEKSMAISIDPIIYWEAVS